jgi:hypothetical protein
MPRHSLNIKHTVMSALQPCSRCKSVLKSLYTHANTHRTHTHIHLQSLALDARHTYTHIQTHTYTHIQTHTFSLSLALSLALSLSLSHSHSLTLSLSLSLSLSLMHLQGEMLRLFGEAKALGLVVETSPPVFGPLSSPHRLEQQFQNTQVVRTHTLQHTRTEPHTDRQTDGTYTTLKHTLTLSLTGWG